MNSEMVKYLVESMINKIEPNYSDNSNFLETLESVDLYQLVSERWINEKECFEMVIKKHDVCHPDAYSTSYLLVLPADVHGGNYNTISDDLDQIHNPSNCYNY